MYGEQNIEPRGSQQTPASHMAWRPRARGQRAGELIDNERLTPLLPPVSVLRCNPAITASGQSWQLSNLKQTQVCFLFFLPFTTAASISRQGLTRGLPRIRRFFRKIKGPFCLVPWKVGGGRQAPGGFFHCIPRGRCRSLVFFLVFFF